MFNINDTTQLHANKLISCQINSQFGISISMRKQSVESCNWLSNHDGGKIMIK